jgi:hypothetical protein
MSKSNRTSMAAYEARLVLSRFVREQAARARSELGFGWIGTDPAPSSYQQLRGAFVQSERTGEPLPISNLFSDSTTFVTPGDNVAFRFWHDVSHVRRGLSFELGDELELAQWHLDQLERAGYGPGTLPYDLLTADLVGQLLLNALIGRLPFDQAAFVETCEQVGLVRGLIEEIRRVA